MLLQEPIECRGVAVGRVSTTDSGAESLTDEDQRSLQGPPRDRGSMLLSYENDDALIVDVLHDEWSVLIERRETVAGRYRRPNGALGYLAQVGQSAPGYSDSSFSSQDRHLGSSSTGQT